MRKTVAFGFVGTVLDYAGRGSQRWSKWRPSLCLCQQESLVINRLELLHDARCLKRLNAISPMFRQKQKW
ncbi:transcriptional regulator [Escherichia coli]|uniref:RNA repair transcriptional activator RtcR family protein n=1 Tax=Escherichia coli TaxID=562 RepID=UPI00025C7FD9|nr:MULTISPECIES: RNA repair transcriptional activator RtcR family protein [Escherichia]EIG81114.1 regulator of RNA terminal phosphate cyclase domain protein [Escherichia coli 1.2741]OTB62866.1 transcriptional regulator [Escherichia coli]OTC19832.1 transcriptional regulator [Escherichia coli]OTE57096.1 transcriptional regulator [Escherichia coli]